MKSSLVRAVTVAAALSAVLTAACRAPVDAPADGSIPTDPQNPSPQATNPTGTAAFVGYWRSVTPSLEFVRLGVSPLSVARDALGIQLAFSGVMWEGGGRISGDSAVIPATTMRGGEPIGTVVLRSGAGRTMTAELRSPTASPMVMTFVREP